MRKQPITLQELQYFLFSSPASEFSAFPPDSLKKDTQHRSTTPACHPEA
jgi:hypothetical protein